MFKYLLLSSFLLTGTISHSQIDISALFFLEILVVTKVYLTRWFHLLIRQSSLERLLLATMEL